MECLKYHFHCMTQKNIMHFVDDNLNKFNALYILKSFIKFNFTNTLYEFALKSNIFKGDLIWVCTISEFCIDFYFYKKKKKYLGMN